jgi:O-methyltransferase
MLRWVKRGILSLFDAAGYELVKRGRQPLGPPSLDRTMARLRDWARDPNLAAHIFDNAIRDVVAPHHRSVFWGDRLITLDKSVGFRQDPGFVSMMRQVNSDTGATQYTAPDGISWRLNTLVWAARTALHVRGDFVECGVYQGDMSWAVTELVEFAGTGRTFYLYDTFEGFAPKYSSEDDFPLAPEFFHAADRGYKIPDLYETVRDRFAAKSYAKVIKGVVPDILDTIAPTAIAFLHIDLNSAAPEIGALKRLFDRVSPGGIIVFDDYGWALHSKQKEAEDRFMAERGYEIMELPTGQGLLVKL